MHRRRLLWPKPLGGKLLVLACSFVFVVIAVYQFAVWSLTRQLDALLEADRRKGLPTTLAEAYGPAIPESENAEGPLLAAAKIAEGIHQHALRETFGDKPPDPRQDSSYLSSLGRLAVANPAFDKHVADAQSRPRFVFSERLEDCRAPSRRFANQFSMVLQVEAARALHEMKAGKRNIAMERLIRLYRLARRGYEAAPFFDWWNIVNNIIRDKVHWTIDQVLMSGDVSKETRDTLEEALAQAEDNIRSAAWAHQGQKLFLLSSYQTYDQTPQVLSPWHELRPIDLRNRLEIAEAVAQFAPRESVSGNRATEVRRRHVKERVELLKSPLYRALLLPAQSATLNEIGANYIPFREMALARCLRVLNALQRHNGAVTDIAQLGLPPTATIDPFTEEPLRIVKTKTGWVVFSLGEDQKDVTTTEAPQPFGNFVVGNVDELPNRQQKAKK